MAAGAAAEEDGAREKQTWEPLRKVRDTAVKRRWPMGHLHVSPRAFSPAW